MTDLPPLPNEPRAASAFVQTFPRKQARRVEHAATRRRWNTWYQTLDTLKRPKRTPRWQPSTRRSRLTSAYLGCLSPSTRGSVKTIRHSTESVTPVQAFWRRS